MADAVPVWVWLPGTNEPVHAGHIAPQSSGKAATFSYHLDYLGRPDRVALDPLQLRLRKGSIGLSAADGLPGVIRDAKPAGYGQDRLVAREGRDLAPLELLELGPADAVGAIEVCRDLARKRQWRAIPMSDLTRELSRLDEHEPSSRAIRRINDDRGTSAGGERPKATFEHEGRLWLVKMKDRGDLAGMPAREYTAMSLARLVGIDTPEIRLITEGAHQAFMIERFDRSGDPAQPTRKLFASAHTALALNLDAVRGDARRSYLVLADAMRSWGAKGIPQLWKRMAFNALVGNVDDHPRNHGLLHDGTGWQLSPAFDITPIFRPVNLSDEPAVRQLVLTMNTSASGGGTVDALRLLRSAPHFELDMDEAARWLQDAANAVTQQWEGLLRQALAPLPHKGQTIVDDTRISFCFAQALATDPGQVEQALEELKRAPARRRTLAIRPTDD